MKKLLSLIMAMVLASALFGCGSPDSSSSGGDSAGGLRNRLQRGGETQEKPKAHYDPACRFLYRRYEKHGAGLR